MIDALAFVAAVQTFAIVFVLAFAFFAAVTPGQKS